MTELRAAPDTTIDWRDIDASLRGDAAAFQRLVQRYQAAVFAQMWRFSRDPRVQEELVQDVFVEVYQSLKGYRGDAPFVHWIRRIATRTGYRHWKRLARDQRLQEALRFEPNRIQPEAAAPSEAAEYLFQILGQLAPKDRLVLTLMYFEDCDSNEIAARMGWSATLVRVRAHRARQRLRELLVNAGYGRADHE